MSIEINPFFGNVPPSYLFSEVAARVAAAKAGHPKKRFISLGIGDVTLPLPFCAVKAAVEAAEEQGKASSFHGYSPENGYDFLRKAISEYYARMDIGIAPTEVYVTDGAKSILGCFSELVGDETLLVPTPNYPVMTDSWLMSGKKTVFLSGDRENGFLPSPPHSAERFVIYLCSPGNPTGAAYTVEGLAEWVDFALSTGSLIVFDAAYASFASNGIPRSIFAVKNAKKCALEVGSLSKSAGFTGMRCGWLVVPSSLSRLSSAWKRRQATVSNGVPYIIQRAAEAVLSVDGERECYGLIAYYRDNASILSAVLKKHGLYFCGGESSPYLFAECPSGYDSWELFDRLLEDAGIVCTPGSGFGNAGEGFFRLSAFGTREDISEAAERLDGFLP